MRRHLLCTALVLSPLAAADLGEQVSVILKRDCHACHGAAMQMSKLDLRTRDRILAGGERGAAVTPHNLGRSFLWKFVAHEQKPHMPPGRKLAEADIDLLRRWIIAGAPMPEADPTGEEADPTGEEAERRAALAKLEERPITDEERDWWAFQPPVRHDPPGNPSGHPVDAFLLDAIQRKGLTPAPRADRRTLIRRAHLDLTGLPPSPDEVDGFLKDTAPDAWQRLINRLLESPHYGERWGRHWLDLVRYADSGGFERDFDWPSAWRYRDYIVSAFNSDKPYDLFLREQLAGDEFSPESDEAHIATGFLCLGPDNNIKDERTRMDELDDIVATTSLAIMGLTVGCARCHNHKFDPIPQKDYYRMQAVFFSTKFDEYPLAEPDVVAAYDAEMKRIDALVKPLQKKKKAIEKPYHDRLFEERVAQLPEYMQIAWHTPADKRTEGQRLNARQIEKTLKIEEQEILAIMSVDDRKARLEITCAIEDLKSQRPEKYDTARVIAEEGPDPLPSYFLHRGSVDMKGSQVSPGVLSVVADGEVPFPKAPEGAASSERRKHFATWLTSPDHPLTARVMVNRIWQHHFGEGIVRTTSNFGKTGEAPSHPELLDWLATEFVRSGWSVKAMHRLLMTSDAYQRSSNDIEANLAVDGENRFFWRAPRPRLEAEIIRDSILAVGGTLDRATGGPGVFPYIDPSLFQSSTSRTWNGKRVGDPSTWRRSLYVFTKRSIRYPLFETFDQPDTINSCARRNRSTTAPQALLLMNNAFVVLQAERFAERVRREAGEEATAQIERAYQLALARSPNDFERTAALEFLGGSPDALADFCQTLFNLNEFVYRP